MPLESLAVCPTSRLSGLMPPCFKSCFHWTTTKPLALAGISYKNSSNTLVSSCSRSIWICKLTIWVFPSALVLKFDYLRTARDISNMPMLTHQLCDSSSAIGFLHIQELSTRLGQACQAGKDLDMTLTWDLVFALEAEMRHLKVDMRMLYLKLPEHWTKIPWLG